MNPNEQIVVNTMSVDVEDYFHAEALASFSKREDWDQMESRVVGNTRSVLELFARHNTQATFFVLGWVAQKFPGLVREIQSAGHEIACHSFWHRLIYKLTPEEFQEDTQRARRAIEDAAGTRLQGYRAPTFSITRRSLWALDILQQEGFTYDSSIFPTRHDFYGIPDFSRFSCHLTLPRGGEITEFPMSTFRRAGHNWPFGGGGYLRIFPAAYSHHGFSQVNQQEGQPVHVYFHPWEFDPEQPRFPLQLRSRLRHYTNLKAMKARVAALLTRYRFAPLGTLLAEKARAIPQIHLKGYAA